MWRYVQIKSLEEASPLEKIIASYVDSDFTVEGYKTDEKIIAAEDDSKKGKCKLLVWKKFKDSEEAFDNIKDALLFYKVNSHRMATPKELYRLRLTSNYLVEHLDELVNMIDL